MKHDPTVSRWAERYVEPIEGEVLEPEWREPEPVPTKPMLPNSDGYWWVKPIALSAAIGLLVYSWITRGVIAGLMGLSLLWRSLKR